ncbi:MAG: T9SS type A sorting domain-containing protein [Bacteroidota bacterium]|nr:T9SS type A sorting domain-containing protein [Bacteroidota bacterium]
MKKLFCIIMIGCMIFSITPGKVYAVKHIIHVQNFSFNPSSLSSVSLGDTIKWVWVNGTHTTTSTTIPLGAASWDNPINSSDSVFEYVPIVTGVFNYKCIFHASMGMIGSFTVLETNGVSENQSVPVINIYPNPSKEGITLEYDNSFYGLKEIQVYDFSGKMIKEIQVLPVHGNSKIDMDVSTLPRGTFYIKLIDTSGKVFSKEMILI